MNFYPIARALFIALLALATSAFCASAQVLSFDQARQRADNGDAFAQAVVALHYQLGWNTQKNPDLAAKYAIASAEAGDPLGKFRLGALLRAGEGVQKDEKKGLALQAASFNSLHEAQDPYSITSAAIMIFQGKVVGQDISQDERRRDAAALYKKGADMNYAPAQFNYAMAVNDGHGAQKNSQQSQQYLNEALKFSYPPAQAFSLGQQRTTLGDSLSKAMGSVEGTNYEGKRWAYEFVTHAVEPTLDLRSDSAGLLAYADSKYVVRAAELPGTAGNAKTELSFYDAQTCRLLGTVSVPNRVFAVGALGKEGAAVFYIGTVTPAKYRYDDYPLAITLVDFGRNAIERLPLISEDYWLALQNKIVVEVRDNQLQVKIRPGLAGQYLSSQPTKKEFKEISLALSETPLDEGEPDYLNESRETHQKLASVDAGGLNYAGVGAGIAKAPSLSRGQFAVGQGSQSKAGTVVRAGDTGQLSVLRLSELRTDLFPVDSSGVFSPHIFEDGSFACVASESLHILHGENKRQITLPEDDIGALRIVTRGLDILEAPQSMQEWIKVFEEIPRKLVFSGNTVGYRRGNDFHALEKSSQDGFNKLEPVLSVVSELRKSKYNRIVDWDLASNAFVVSQHQFEMPQFQRVSALTGEAVGQSWDGGAQNDYDGISSSAVSGGWRAYSYINDSSTGGASACVVLEKNSKKSEPVFVAGSLTAVADPLAVRVDGSKALVVYGSGDAVSLDSVNLPGGGINRLKTWTFGSRFGNAMIDSASGHLFIPNASGFEVWSVWQQEPSKRFDLVLGDADQYAVVLPNGKYAGSPGCESLLRLKAGDGKVDGSSIAIWRNCPAEVLEALGGDPEQIEVLAKVTERWHKRIDFDPSKPEPRASDLPKVSVSERPRLWAESDQVQFLLAWKAGASPVSRVTVRVNGVESGRFEGDKLPTTNKDQGSVYASVKLAEGQNWIEVIAEDVEGRRSDLQRFRTILKDTPTETKRYIVALGVSEYAKPELNLQFAAKDAKDLLEALAGKGVADTGMFAKVFGQSGDAQGSDHVLLLTNDQVDRSAVEKIREFVGKSSENDEVILFCAGHGVLDDKLDYYYAGHDFDPERPAETGIKLDDLVGAVSSAKALKRLVLLDTCHAGVVGEKDEMLLAQMDTKLPSGVRAVAQRGMKVQQAADFSASDKQRFIEEMFSLPGTIRGVNIIGASAGAQFALESDKWNNGVFTASVIEGLRDKKADWNQDGCITVSELKNYLGQRVSELTAGAQKPSVVAFEQDQDFDLLN